MTIPLLVIVVIHAAQPPKVQPGSMHGRLLRRQGSRLFLAKQATGERAAQALRQPRLVAVGVWYGARTLTSGGSAMQGDGILREGRVRGSVLDLG